MRVIANVGLLPEVPAGPERMIAALVRAMLDRDPELQVTLRAMTWRNVQTARAAFGRIDSRAEPAVSPVPQRLVGPLQAAVRFPPERAFVGRFDAFHQFHLDTDPAVPSRRLVVTVNDTVAALWPGEDGMLQRRAGRLVRRAARVVTPSSFSRDAAIANFGVDPAHVSVVPNGVDGTRFAPDGPARDGDYVLYVGGTTPRKNVPRIIEALAILRASGRPELRLVLAGPVLAGEARLRAGTPAALEQTALDFVGHVSDEELAALYRGAQALVFPSLHEGFGLPVLEAMACGTAVVTSNTTALPEAGGEPAVYVDPRSTDSIVDGIAGVLAADRPSAERRRAAGIARAARFSWDAAAEAMLSLYRELG